MKRIAYLCLSEGWGGLEMNQLRSAQAMQSLGHEVLLIINLGSPIHEAAKRANTPFYIVQQKPKHYQWLFALKLVLFLKKYSYHHLFFRNARELSIAASVSFFSLKKIKTHYFMEMALGGRRTQFFRTWRYTFLSTWVCPLPYLKKQVLEQTKISSQKVLEIPSGLFFDQQAQLSKEEARAKLNWPVAKKLIVVVGRIDPKKRQAFVWDCFAQRKQQDELLIFVGQSTPDESSIYFKNLREEVNAHPKNKQVIWAGFQENMPLIYCAADLIIMAADHETIGMATLEALQNHCPVLGANNGGSKEIIDLFGGGGCFESNSIAALSNGMDLLFAGAFPALNYRLFKQHFDFKRVCRQVETEVLGLEAPIFK